jgi:hypothetical protein
VNARSAEARSRHGAHALFQGVVVRANRQRGKVVHMSLHGLPQFGRCEIAAIQPVEIA